MDLEPRDTRLWGALAAVQRRLGRDSGLGLRSVVTEPSVGDAGTADRWAPDPWSAVISLVREQRWPLVVWSAMVGWTAVLFVAVKAHFAEFRLQRYDLGNMVQAVWSTAEGRPLEQTLGTGEQATRLAAHVDPILGLLAPFWMVSPSPVTLATVQLVACALGALPVFWLARRHLGSEKAAALLSLTYLMYPWLVWTSLDALHPVTLAIPLTLYAIWFLYSERLWAFALCAVLVLACGELMGLTVAGLGLWYWLSRGHRRDGAVIAGAGLMWTMVCLKLVIPAFSGKESVFYGYFAHVGGSPEGVFRTALTNPEVILRALFTDADLIYALALTVPVGGLFLFAPGLAAVALPTLGANALSSIGGATDPRGHHVSGIVAFAVAASVLGLARLPQANRARAAALMLALCAAFSVMFGPWPGVPGPRVPWVHAAPSPIHVAALRDGVALVPEDVPVSATNKAGSHLSDRRYFYSVPHLPGNTEWVVVDISDAWVPLPPQTVPRLTWGRVDYELVRKFKDRLVVSPEWEMVYVRNAVYVFKRVEPASRQP